jgi:hypothetical protein
VTTAAPTTAPSTSVAIPVPRPAAEQEAAPRRQRPPSQYWDVFEACWRSGPGR